MTPPRRPLSILVGAPDVPPPDRDSGSLRLFRLLELLAAEGHRLTLVARAGVGQQGAVRALENLGVEVHPVDPERCSFPLGDVPSLDLRALVARVRPDVAWLSFYDTAEVYLPLLRRLAPACRVVVDTVDVHWVREARAADVSGDVAEAQRALRTRDREQAVYGTADALVAVSDEDAAALRELAPGVPVAVVSNVHAPEPEGPGRADRHGVLFVGNFRHTPNVDAAVHLVRDIWPAVRAALPGARLRLVGTAPPPAVQELACADVEVTGWVPETEPYLHAAAVSVAPLRYGAGVKGKIGEALAHGLPVVTTTVGAEGMDLRDGEDVLVADDPRAFAEAIVRAQTDAGLWERLSHNGRGALARRLSPGAALAALRALLAELAPATFIAGDDLAADLAGYLAAFTPQDPVSLVVPLRDGDDAGDVLGSLVTTIEALGHDPEAIPDVAVSAWPAGATAPASAVAAPADWRAALDVPQPPQASVALLVRLPDDAGEAAVQLDAVLAAGVPRDVDLVVCAADGLDVPAAGRVVRVAPGAGRRSALVRAVHATTAEIVVALEPHTLPQSDFLAPLVRAIEDGALLAGPVVDGHAGLRVGPDGALWPDGDDALALDCLAARRTTWLAMPAALPSREGHAETQLGTWARERGTLVVAGASHVSRAPFPAATVIICTRDRADVLEDCVALVVAQRPAEVLIVDNGSSDATPQVAATLAARHPGIVRVVDEPEAGLSHARNAGARAASHELLVYLDDDARPAPGWLAASVRAVAGDGVAIAGGPIAGLWPAQRTADWPAPGLEALYGVLDHGDADRTLVAPEVVYGGNWCVKRSVLLAVGAFDPAFGVGPDQRIGGEEVSVAWRVQRAGLGSTRYVGAGGVGHLIGPQRLNDRFLVQRSLTVGLERPRYGDGDRATLMGAANGAAQRLLAAVPLTGALRLEDAVDAIAAAPVPQGHKTYAADALGELTAALVLMGEGTAQLGPLTLQVREHHLRGVLEPVPA